MTKLLEICFWAVALWCMAFWVLYPLTLLYRALTTQSEANDD